MKTRTHRTALALALLALPIMMGADGSRAGCGTVVIGGGDDPGQGEQPSTPGNNGNPGQGPGEGPSSCGGELHLFGVYETHSNHGYGNHPMGAATVHVERQGAQVLALSSYEPVHWTITAAPGAVIEKVIINGHHEQTADAPPGVPVEVYSYEDGGNWLGGCAYTWPGDDQGCDTQGVVSTLEQMTGRQLTTFHGCYQGTSYVLHDDLDATVACTDGQGELTSHIAAPDCDDPAEPPPGGDACDGASGLGLYQGWICDSNHNFIITQQISCQEALDNCQLNASSNPALSFYCTWNGQPIHEAEITPGACDALSGD